MGRLSVMIAEMSWWQLESWQEQTKQKIAKGRLTPGAELAKKIKDPR